MLKFDERNNILYRISPMAQVAVGRFFGYLTVFESYANSIDYDSDKHQVEFTYNNLSQWNKLLEYIY